MSKYNMYVEDVSVEAVFNKLGGAEGAKRFLRDELSVTEPTRSWREEDGVIYFSVTSDGTTGEGWIRRLKEGHFRTIDDDKEVLRLVDFKPTTGVTTEVAVLRGMLFDDQSRIIKNIIAEADKHKFSRPNTELSCLIRVKFTNKEIQAMGLKRIVAVHESFGDYDFYPFLLGGDTFADGYLYECGGSPDSKWHRNYGFAFVVSSR